MLKSRNKGFLLLEVMLSVTILSLGLVMVVRSLVSSLRVIKTSHDFLVANLLLEGKLWQRQEEKFRSGRLVVNKREEVFETPFEKFKYNADFESYPEVPDLYRSISSVSWRRGKIEHSVSCVGYVWGKSQ